jgi:predicted RND superfamily exporter protein
VLEKFARILTRRYGIVLAVAVLLLIPSAVGAAGTRVNYDILSYLPQDMDSSRGERVLEDTFHNAATTMLVVEGMPERYVADLREKIERVEGVSSAVWIDQILDLSVPKEILPEDIKNIFYSEDSTMLIIQYDLPGASEETMRAIDEVRALCNTQCFLSGFSVIIRDTCALSDQEMPIYVLAAVILSMLAMAVTTEAWVLPVVLILGIGFAIAFNLGTNIFLGEISYVTQAIAAILQLGVTMDYSIFLIHRYIEEKPKFPDRRDAMASAIVSAFVSLSGSSMTTIAGFLALCFMQLLLGRDIGIVMAKGVVLGVLTVVMVLPALVLQFDKAIQRWRHRSIIPDFTRVNRFIVRHYRAFVALFLLLLAPAYYAQSHVAQYYNLADSLPDTLPSIIALDKMKTQFNMASTHFIIVSDELPAYRQTQLLEEIEKVDGIESVIGYNKFVGPAIPDSFVPQEIRDICKKDGKQMIMVNSAYKPALDEENAQIDALTAIVKSYDPEAMITGEGAMTKDLIETASVDFQVTNAISIAAILLIVGLCFRSVSVPIILVAAIELSIFINIGISYLTGAVIPFISPTVIGCIQLGATVDYAILMTTRFREELRAGVGKQEAIAIAANAADSAIITSSLVLFCATFGVSAISKIEIIQSICLMLARGALVSALVSIFILPSVLLASEGLIAKTSKDWRNAPVKKEKRRGGRSKGPQKGSAAPTGA